MPAATLPPPAFVRILRDSASIPQSQGDEGQRVRAAARQAALHWEARPSCAIETSEVDDPFSYEPVPLKIVGTARVQCRMVGRLPPSSYSPDR